MLMCMPCSKVDLSHYKIFLVQPAFQNSSCFLLSQYNDQLCALHVQGDWKAPVFLYERQYVNYLISREACLKYS